MKCFLCVNSVSRLCLLLRDVALEFNLPFDMCRWLVEGEDVEVVHEVLIRHHQRLTNHQLLISKLLLRIAAAAIAQASVTGGQRGPSNLQRFRAHHLSTFTRGGDSMVADHWFMQVKKVLEAMEITSDTTRIRLAAFQLEGEAQVWWNWTKTFRDLEAMTWAEFQELFMGKYFSDTTHHAKAQEFLELKHGTMTVMDYVARFTELARFANDYVATDMAKVKRFKNGLKLSIRGRIVGLRLRDMDSMVGTGLTIEREIEDARSTRDEGVSSKRKESQSSSSSGKKQGLLAHEGSRVAAIQARDRSGLPVRLGRCVLSLCW